MPLSSANSLINTFLNFPITIQECKICFLATNLVVLEVMFHFVFALVTIQGQSHVFLSCMLVFMDLYSLEVAGPGRVYDFAFSNIGLVCSNALNVTALLNCQLS